MIIRIPVALNEAGDKQFTNPILNKKIQYLDNDGEKKENLVGNLLRLAKNHPGRLAAEKMLPKPGTAQRNSINKVLGREKGGGLRPGTPKLGGDKQPETPQAAGQPKQAEPQQLFKSDPAITARLDKEKEIQKKIVGDKVGTTDKVKQIASNIKEKISDWNEKDKEFFKQYVHKGNSPERRSWGEALKDKAKGAWVAIKKGLQHEGSEVKNAAIGMKNLVMGKKLSSNEVDAIKAVTKTIVTTALFGAAMGGLEHGVGDFAKHVAVEIVPHTIGEVITLGTLRAAINAGEEDVDKYFQIFIDKVAEQMTNMKITPEMMEHMVDSYNKKRGN
jgi:hypothetical protein